MATRLQIRRGSAASWAAANPVLAQGELGYEVDTTKHKLGDGVTAWNALGYAIPGPPGDSALPTPFTASISGAYTLDVTKPVQWLTITGATTITMPPVPTDKTVPLTVIIQQNVVGGYAVTLPTSASTPKCWWAQGIPPTLDTTANARHWLYFVGAPGLDWTGFASALKVA